ncbi:tetratricopeptide repeat protein [Azospirillum sp.]|uniref:tetratricopeptide repeat protein n=1 Tax=Azospirillum sp. TaxID=34012 RepID=UPI003D751FA0
MATLDEALRIGVQHHQGGRLDAAAAIYRRVLAVVPDDGNALHLLGLATLPGDLRRGRRLLVRAVRAAPVLAPAQSNLARQFMLAGCFADADAACRRAIAAAPDLGDAYGNFAAAQLGLDRADEACAAHRRQLRINPADTGGWIGLGNAERRAGRDAAAIAAWRQALRRDPGVAAPYGNLGIALKDIGQGDAGIACHRRALALHPENPDFHLNHGVALRDLARLEDAEAAFNRALRLRPGHAGTLVNRAHGRLVGGDFARGLPDYEARWRFVGAAPRRVAGEPWDGTPLDGRTILVHCEQGLGDTLLFCRYVPLIAKLGGRVVLEVQAPLERLMRSLDGVERLVVKDRDPLPACDRHAPIASLPWLFRSTLETLPAEVPYLRPQPDDVARWRARIGAGQGVCVGLVWAGNPAFAADRFRSPRLEAVLPLLQVPGVRFFGLQAGDGLRDLEGRAMPASFTSLAGEVGDFLETAAATAAMDVVVTCCTAQAHLSGALGTPVWGMFNLAPDWRWLLEREDCPWYPSMRMFRQTRWGDWTPVMRRIAMELRRLAAGDRSGLAPFLSRRPAI